MPISPIPRQPIALIAGSGSPTKKTPIVPTSPLDAVDAEGDRNRRRGRRVPGASDGDGRNGNPRRGEPRGGEPAERDLEEHPSIETGERAASFVALVRHSTPALPAVQKPDRREAGGGAFLR
jgi:hypothetical protein